MGLSSVMQTALTGISAAKSSVGVIANNLANANTPGFKQSRVALATQTPMTNALGAAPSATSGGTNPAQTGPGVSLAAIQTDFTQGTIKLSNRPTDLALEGQGMFVVQGDNNEKLYTRDGNFGRSANGELVTNTGYSVLGHGVDDNFNIQSGGLTAIRIPAGMQARSDDGSAATLVSFSVAENGLIKGRFTDGEARDLGQIQVARFANPSGLVNRGNNLYSAGPNSGTPVHSNASEGGSAKIVAGATELSNTDIGENLIGLTESSTQIRASTAVLGAAEELFDELLQLGRRR